MSLLHLLLVSDPDTSSSPLSVPPHNDTMVHARSILHLLAGLLALVVSVSAAPVPSSLDKRIVYNPPITYPTQGVTWSAGQAARVAW